MPTSEDAPLPSQHYLSDMEILSAPSPTKLSEGGHMRRRYKTHRLSKKRSVHDYSKYTDDGAESTTDTPQWSSLQNNSLTKQRTDTPQWSSLQNNSLTKQRSVSLTTLNNSLGQLTAASSSALLQPRMAQLETLEAKMASIEVSLSSTCLSPTATGVRRTKRMAPSPTPRSAPSPVSTLSVRSTPAQPTRIEIISSPISESDSPRNVISDKENVIQSLKSKLNSSSICSPSKGINLRIEGKCVTPVSPTERKVLENRVAKLKQEIESKRTAVKNLKSTLDQLDITDNIDVRIRQAEVEFQLGREELALLSLTEELRNLTTRLDIGTLIHSQPAVSPPQTTHHMTLFGIVSAAIPNPLSMHAVLLPISLLYDPCNPVFGISDRLIPPGVASVEWAKDEECGLKPNDRIIEANGQLLSRMKQDSLKNLLNSTNLTQLRLVVIRSYPISHKQQEEHSFESAEYLEKTKKAGSDRSKLLELENLKAENLRLSHRIFYLEEQVADLISSDEQVKTPSVQQQQQPVYRAKGEVHVFQKGSHTAIVSHAKQDKTGPRSRWQEESEYSDSRSTRSLDVNKYKPAPPKKPQRLSLLRATSLQQGIDTSEVVAPRKPSKRPHKNVVAIRPDPQPHWTKQEHVLPASAQYHNQHVPEIDARENWC
ncbi:uncharacterized protein sprt isoform X2 [Cloeon dipterum]